MVNVDLLSSCLLDVAPPNLEVKWLSAFYLEANLLVCSEPALLTLEVKAS